MSAHTLKVPKALREQALRAAAASPQGLVCAVCGRPFGPGDAIEADHITPVSRGGANALHNLRLAHPRCNKRAWRDYAAWERAAALAPWFVIVTRFCEGGVCCDASGVIRAADHCFRSAIGRTLRDVVGELLTKRQLIRWRQLGVDGGWRCDPPEARSA